MRDRRRQGVEVEQTKSSPTDIVTAVDRAAEELIHARLVAARPDDGFLGEEGAARESASGVTWVVDPIDGTVNFLYGLPQYAISIAATVDGETVAGVVLNVVSGECFTATRGGGAWCDGERLAVRAHAPVSERLVFTGFSYERDVRPGRPRPSPRCWAGSATYAGSAPPPWTCVPRRRAGRRLRRGGAEPLGRGRGRAGGDRGGCPPGDPPRGGRQAVRGVRPRRRVRRGRGPGRGVRFLREGLTGNSPARRAVVPLRVCGNARDGRVVVRLATPCGMGVRRRPPMVHNPHDLIAHDL